MKRAFLLPIVPAVVLAVAGSTPAADLTPPAPPVWRVENIDAPPGIDPQVGALSPLPDGRMAVAFHRGEVAIYDPRNRKWSIFARGLHEPLGLLPVSDREMLVMQRPELTRLTDDDGDGSADRYETVWDGFGMTGNYHEFAYGPVRAKNGDLFVGLNLASNGASVFKEVRGPWNDLGGTHDDFFTDWKNTSKRIWKMYSKVPLRGCIVRLDARTGKAEPFSYGWRSPDGLMLDAADRLLVTDNQGDWVATSSLSVSRAGAFHGHPASLVWRDGWTRNPMEVPGEEYAAMRTRPAVLFPHGTMANSPTQPALDNTAGKFGPFSGQIVVGEMNTPRLIRVMPDEIGGTVQGACTPLINGGGLRAGVHRLAFAPDGSLWTGHTHLAWAGGEGLQRLVWSGTVPFEVLAVHMVAGGFELKLTDTLKTAPDAAAWKIRRYRYLYHRDYGSPETEKAGVPVKSAVVSADGRTVTLQFDEPLLGDGTVYEFSLPALVSAAGLKLGSRLICYTSNRTVTQP